MRVLIADDDPVSLRLLEAALHKLGHEVVAADDGATAWVAFQASDFPLVITDWMMPRMSGIVLCENIRAAARDKYSYIVMVTTLSGQEDTLLGFRAGVDDYMVKPVRFDELERRILVAQRVRDGMVGRIEATMRRAVEECEAVEGGGGPNLIRAVGELSEFYRSERVYAKARAFLRRQINLMGAHGGDADKLEALRQQLSSLEANDDVVG